MPAIIPKKKTCWILWIWTGLALMPGAMQAQEPDSTRDVAMEPNTAFYNTIAASLDYNFDLLRIARLTGIRHLEGQPLAAIAEDYLDLENADGALAYYDSALTIARLAGDKALESRVLHGLGRVYHRYASPPDLARATAYYAAAAQARAAIRSGAGADRLKVSAAEQSFDVFADWTAAWLARTHDLGTEIAALGALAAAERGRAQALLDLMDAAPDAMRSQAPLPGDPGSANVSVPGVDALSDTEKAWVAEGKHLIDALTRPQTTIVSYMLVGDMLATWIIPPSGKIRLVQRSMVRPSIVEHAAINDMPRSLREQRFRAAARDSLARLVGAVRLSVGAGSDAFRTFETLERSKIVRGMDVGNFEEAVGHLQAVLFPPEALRAVPPDGTVIIVPYGPIALVPFAALPVEDTLFGARYALRYAPSLKTLARAQEASGRRTGAPSKETLAGALIVGNPDMPVVDSTQLLPLPAAEEEAAWLADLLNSRFLSGPEATEHAVKEALAEAPLVHLATHGFAYSDEHRTRDSFVALAPGPDQDGLLRVGEVLDDVPLLDADLVVLSACQTGLGNLTQAEGTIGLQRAFLAKGARSVLVSLWNVSDEATSLLMKRFYTHWLDEGLSKADALRHAQADVRTDSRFEDARFWAAFQLVGAD